MSGFQFKQFFIAHDKSAMKVNTDGILLGALADVAQAKQIVDLGTGTGLVAIMLDPIVRLLPLKLSRMPISKRLKMH